MIERTFPPGGVVSPEEADRILRERTPSRLTFRVKRNEPDAQLPIRASTECIGHDVFAYIKTETRRGDKILLPPRTTRAIPTGLTVIPPPGHAAFICSRSGMAKERSIFVTNAPGIIDPDYRGALFILLYNGSWENYWVQHGDRVAQLVVLTVPDIQMQEVQEILDVTERGDGGFGSTGR